MKSETLGPAMSDEHAGLNGCKTLQEAHAALLPGILTIGRRKSLTTKVVDLADASICYQMARDNSGEGGSTFPDGKVVLGGKKYRVSYNGKVWAGTRPWRSGDVPLVVT
jgi:hypothetical protein